MKHYLSKSLFLLLLIPISLFGQKDPPLFDRGPDPNNPMHRELVQIIQDLPNVPGMSEQLEVLVPDYKRGQKFRPDFGAMIFRGLLAENSISVLAIGQDGTHIAEAANRPGIAGFGGRVHDMLSHFGIENGVFFTNLFVNTISGQYGSRNTPVIENGKVIYTNVIENRQWLLTHTGPYAEWRNRLISWVIRNNQESLKMVVMLGQAGKDAGATYINSIGGKVGARAYVGDGSKYKVPQVEMVSAGGNNEWAVPLTADGRDVADVLRQDPKIKKALEDKLKKYESDAAKKLESKINSLAADKKQEVIELVDAYKKARNYYSKKNAFDKLKRKARNIAAAVSEEEKFQKRIKALNTGLVYKDGTQEYGVSTEVAKDLLQDNPKEAERLMVFTEGGPKNNGVLFPEQFGGYDLNSMTGANQKETRSIKGLLVPDGKGGTIVAPDIVFTGAPHPTSLSMNPANASTRVENELLKPLKKEMDRGWKPPKPEPGLTSSFPNKPYKYGRALIPVPHGDPFMPRFRLTPVSQAVRESGGITTGTRNKIAKSLSEKQAEEFDKKVRQLKRGKPSNESLLASNEVLTGRPRNDEWLFRYDRGPSDDYYQLMINSINEQELFWPKSAYAEEARIELEKAQKNILKKKTEKILTIGEKQDALVRTMDKIFNKYGIKAFNVKSHPNNGPYSHYRGTFDNPKVIILADPHGYDDFATSKALTGSRGQYLNGLMADIGVEEKYLVIKTVPVEMDGATKTEWEATLKSTREYREKLFTKLLEDNPDAVILTDGKYAAEEMRGLTNKDFISIKRGVSDASGIKQAGKKLKKLSQFSGSNITAKRIDIYREHLTFIARVWEGTSGDRVIMGGGKEAGKNYHIQAPSWATKNEVQMREETLNGLRKMIAQLVENGEPKPREKIGDFIKRRMKKNPYFRRKFRDCLDAVKQFK